MMRLTVHALGGDRLLVCSDGGRRWVLEAQPSQLDEDAVQEALASLRQQGSPAPAAPQNRSSVTVACLRDLLGLAAAVTSPTTARWTFAGRVHRVLLTPPDAEVVAKEVLELLLATVADPEEAAALAGSALLDEMTGSSQAIGKRNASGEWECDGEEGGDEEKDEAEKEEETAPLESGLLERWMDGSWHQHRFDPPPLVDPVTGILRRIVERPREPEAPPGFVHLHAELPHLSSVDRRFQPDPLAPAGAFRGSKSSPEHEAILSGLAHMCGTYLGQGTRRSASAAHLRQEGERVLTVSQWGPHDPRLHEIPGFPFLRDHPQLRTQWLLGADEHGTRWVPLSLVYAGYLSSELKDLPPTNGHNLVGLQAGFTEEEALERAAAHLIGQDALARWWDRGAPLPEVSLPEVVLTHWGLSRWRVRVLAVPTHCEVPVRLAVVDDPTDGVITLGYGCARSSEDAAEQALLQHACARDLTRPDSLIRNAAALGNGGVLGLAEHDPQRCYASAFANRRRMLDQMCHLQYGLDPEVVERTRRRVEPTGISPELARKRPYSPYRALKRSGHQQVRIDVTTARVAATGAYTVHLLAPSLQRLTPAAYDVTEGPARDPYPGW